MIDLDKTVTQSESQSDPIDFDQLLAESIEQANARKKKLTKKEPVDKEDIVQLSNNMGKWEDILYIYHFTRDTCAKCGSQPFEDLFSFSAHYKVQLHSNIKSIVRMVNMNESEDEPNPEVEFRKVITQRIIPACPICIKNTLLYKSHQHPERVDSVIQTLK